MHSLHRFLLIDFSMTFDVNHVLLSKLRTIQVPSYLFFTGSFLVLTDR